MPTAEGDVQKTEINAAQFLVASGSQDRHIRVWHIQLTDKQGLSPTAAKEKGTELTVPPAYASYGLFARLECVLSGHDHWVTGVAWTPQPLTVDSRPLLLSASMDKSVVVWEPSHPPLLTTADNVSKDSSTPDLWLEKQRYGTVGGNQLGFLDCAWGNSGWAVYGHGFQGNLSSWSFNETGSGTAQCSLTGHAGPITDLAWSPSNLGKDSKIPLAVDGYDIEYPFYLLTASKDQSVRLHGLFRTDGSGCNPPGAIQAALGLSNQATQAFAADDEDDELGTANALEPNESGAPDIGDPLYPPAEEGLAQSTLWAEIRKLYGHSYEVFCLAAHPKGILVASACKSSKQDSASIFLWRASDWTIHQVCVCLLPRLLNGPELVHQSYFSKTDLQTSAKMVKMT
ncbi:unnamed protein product [Dibothriocephalus latus]|uniref:Elongator complex protein 2 n=1 Tax=Dibothriocephalus latus TaxID=60516 RepID=A0A3P7LJP0_DIBLA|nr:unnamed protein product [Dibothriocephalus latus]